MTDANKAALDALDRAIEKAEYVQKRYDAFRFPKKDAYEGQLFADFANSIFYLEAENDAGAFGEKFYMVC